MTMTLPANLTLPPPEPADHAAPASAARTCIISSEVEPADRQALLDLFARSSPETRRDRFHHALSVFPQLYLDEILSGRQLAVVARDACHEESYGKVFGLASAAPITDGAAEFAVWVEDAWQGREVGSLLTRAILALLADSGMTTAIGIMEPDNLAIRRLVRRIAPHATTRSEDGMIVVSVPLKDLDPIAAPRPAGRRGLGPDQFSGSRAGRGPGQVSPGRGPR
jgi:GNAT superfamily N-acetyltransferase